MEEVGADTGSVHAFLDALRHGTNAPAALLRSGAPAAACACVDETLRTAVHGKPLEVAACLL